MRVCFVPSWYPAPGSEYNGSFFREQARMLFDSGIELLVVVTFPVGIESRAWRKRPEIVDEDGIPVLRVALPTLPPGLVALEHRIHRSLLTRAVRIIRPDLRPDVLHAHTVFPGGTSAALLSEIWKIPYVLTEHRPSSIRADAFLRRRKVIEAAVEGASLLTTVSSRFASALARRYSGTRWLAVELPVPDSFFDVERPPRRGSGPVRFIHVSHIDENKRVIEMCRAFAEAFANDAERAALSVVGGTPEAIAAVRNSLAGCSSSVRIDFLGMRTRAETARALGESDVFVLVSAVEAGGTVLSEAQAAGLRLVASTTWAGEFAVREGNGELVPVDDRLALVAAMRRISEGEKYDSPEDIRRAARERYSTEAFSKRWTEMYDAVVKKSFTDKEGTTL